jgi:hypothetical protein
MKSEMDVLGLDERQRLFWLLANRATLTVVGLVWIGMIIWQWTRGRTDWFLIAMVPTFALARWGFYLYHARRRS